MQPLRVSSLLLNITLFLCSNTSRSNYPDPQRPPLPNTIAAPSPPYNQDSGSQREPESYINRDAPYTSHDPSREVAQRPQPTQQQEQPPSPRKSMFDFVSAFDALSSTGPSSVKKKPPPQVTGASSSNEDSWSSDPKRKSVENLMDQLTRGQVPPSTQASQISYEPYITAEDVPEQVQSRPPQPPLSSKPGRTVSPGASPPKHPAIHRQQRTGDSPISSSAVPASMPNRKDKENPPPSRGGFKPKPGLGGRNKNQSSPRSVLLHTCCSTLSLISTMS